MSIKLYIDETDDRRTKLSKIEKAIADYSKELYEKCHQSSLCSEEAKKYITTSMCHNFTYGGFIRALSIIPSEQEVEIHINPNHVIQITRIAEKRLQENAKQATEDLSK